MRKLRKIVSKENGTEKFIVNFNKLRINFVRFFFEMLENRQQRIKK